MSAEDEVMSLAARVRALEDCARLQGLVTDYARGLDEADRRLLEGILAPDLRARHGEVFDPLEGREAFLAQVEHFAPRWLVVQHHVSNVDIDLAGERATVHAAVRAVHIVELDGEVVQVDAGARYEFGARRRDEATWWFDDLRIHETWADPRIARVYAAD